MSLPREARRALKMSVDALRSGGWAASDVEAAERAWARQLEAGAAWRSRDDARVLLDRVAALVREYHGPAGPTTKRRRGRA